MNSTLQFHFLTSPLAQVSRFPTLRKPIDRRSEWWWRSSRVPFRTRPNEVLSFTFVKAFPYQSPIRFDNGNEADFLTNRDVLPYFFFPFFLVNPSWQDVMKFRKVNIFEKHLSFFRCTTLYRFVSSITEEASRREYIRCVPDRNQSTLFFHRRLTQSQSRFLT